MVKKGRQSRGDSHYSHIRPESVARGERHGLSLHPERRPRGSTHGNAKLTDAKVLEIRALYATGTITKSAIVAQFGVSLSVISEVINRKSWKHV